MEIEDLSWNETITKRFNIITLFYREVSEE